jgi:hypothetical protein
VGSFRSIASPTSFTLKPAASRIPRRTVPAFSSAARCSGLTRMAFAAPIETSAAAPAMPSTESAHERTCCATVTSGDPPDAAGSGFACGRVADSGVVLLVAVFRRVAMIRSLLDA